MRIVLAFLICLIVNNVYAEEWTLIYDGEQLKIYGNGSTYKRNDNLTKIWFMFDLPNGLDKLRGIKSYKQLVEYDCKEDTKKSLYSVFYKGSKGIGDVVSSESSDELKPIIPGTIDDLVYKFVCSL